MLAITDISPSFGAIGTDVPVRISGSGFNAGNFDISAGDGIIVSVDPNNISDDHVDVIFIIDASTTSGERSVSITAGGQTSNSVPFQVVCAIPTNLNWTGNSAGVEMGPHSTHVPGSLLAFLQCL